jgi:amino acid efflux transporter
LNVYLASSSRLWYALATEGKLPGWFAKMSERGFPYRTAIFLFLTNTIELVVSYFYDISVDTLILIPTTLGILVYVIASFACVKLLWNDKIGRISALIASICCLFVAPFAARFLLVPIVVAAGCLLYLRFRPKKVRDIV